MKAAPVAFKIRHAESLIPYHRLYKRKAEVKVASVCWSQKANISSIIYIYSCFILLVITVLFL